MKRKAIRKGDEAVVDLELATHYLIDEAVVVGTVKDIYDSAVFGKRMAEVHVSVYVPLDSLK